MTPQLSAVALYTGILALVALWLMVRVSIVRGQEKVSIGDSGNERLIRAMRGQANFVENVPLVLIMMMLMALSGTPIYVIHAMGAVFTLGRISHAWHFTRDDAPAWQRAFGAISALLLGGVGLIGHALI